MNRFLSLLKKHILSILPLILLVIFILSTWDRNYYIGGDQIFPLKPQDSIIKSIFTWEEMNGGVSFFRYMLLFWQGYFYVFSLFQIPSDIVIKLFIITLYILGYVFAYLFYRALLKDTKYNSKEYASLFALLFFLNPAAILVLVGTPQIYGIVICGYFLIKYLDTKNIFYSIPFAFFLNLSYFPDLPQAKLLIVYSIATFFFLVVYKILRNKSIVPLLKSLLTLMGITILLNAFLLLPFIIDTLGVKGVYQQYTNRVIVYNADADYLSASVPYISRFYNSNLVGKGTDLGGFLVNPIFILWSNFLLIVSFASIFFVKEKSEKKILFISLCAFVLFVFIAKGANPPFGEVYRFAINNIPIIKLFRTTATAIVGGLPFFALLATITVFHLTKKNKVLLYIFILMHVVLYYPIYTGLKLDARLGGNIQQKGVSLPNEYMKMGNMLDQVVKTGKILILPLNDGYISKDWGYFGQSPMPWLTNKPVLTNYPAIDNTLDMKSSQELCSFASLYNVAYLLRERDTISNTLKKNIYFNGKNVFENSYFILTKTASSCFLPQIYIPQNLIYFSGDTKKMHAFSLIDPQLKAPLYHGDEQLVSTSKKIVIEQSPQLNNIAVSGGFTNLDLGQDALIRDVFYPNVSVNPASPLYPIIAWKEDLKLHGQKGIRELIDLQIIAALKRISEIDKWGVGNSWWQDAQKRYDTTIREAIQNAVISDRPRDNLELIYEYLVKSREKIEDISQSGPFWDRTKIAVWKRMFTSLEQEARNALQVPDYNNLSYTIPVPRIGTYQGYLVGDQGTVLSPGEHVAVQIDGKDIVSNSTLLPNGVVSLGLFPISSPSSSVTVRFDQRPNLIDNTQWIIGDQVNTVKTNENGIVFAPNQEDGYYISVNQIAYQEVQGWNPGSTYLLRIKHKDNTGATLRLLVRQKKQIYNRNSDSWVAKEANVVDEFLNTMPHGGESKVLLKADKNALTAWIYLYVNGGSVTVEDVRLEKIEIPHLFLVQDNTQQQKPVNTNVRFTKLDPTKYLVHFDKPSDPQILVFSESFDPGWKLFDTNGVSIPTAHHFVANGYANAWQIPAHKTQNGDYMIEYTPQRYLVYGTLISVAVLLTCLAYGGYTIYNKKKNSN